MTTKILIAGAEPYIVISLESLIERKAYEVTVADKGPRRSFGSASGDPIW